MNPRLIDVLGFVVVLALTAAAVVGESLLAGAALAWYAALYALRS